MSIGFDRSRDRRRREITIIKIFKSKSRLKIYLRDIFGFAEHQETATYGLAYKLTLTRNTDNAVSNKDNATNKTKIKINVLKWYVPHYTPSLEKYNNIMNQITRKTPTELLYPANSVFMKKVNTQTFWTFDLGTQKGTYVPIWNYVVFQQSDRQHDQDKNNNTFYKMPVTCAHCNIATKNYPDSAILLNYNDDD